MENPITLQPESTPYDKGFFTTKDGHELYFERHGNPHAAEKTVHLHGGPGTGCSYNEYRYFNPAHHDLLLFDQRGAPKSVLAKNNGIDIAVQDVEDLRKHFGHDKWNVVGGSWGSALGMLYAVRHPESVKRLLLRGIFFADKDGAKHITEESGSAAKNRNAHFDAYLNHIPAPERAEGLMLPYHRRVSQGDAEAARLFNMWDTSIATASPMQELLDEVDKNPGDNMALSRTFFHFAVHEFAAGHKTEILDGMKKLDIPVDIIHGRRDHICPVENAVLLHSICKNSRLQVIENAGHMMRGAPATQHAFMAVTDRWAKESTASIKLALTTSAPKICK